ncbi:hypothetical protein EES44_00100 [Streptomyces sp. ADI96-15]|nr:hypothetical protein EES44_00100 [Streptomyces sp. ADI96-15]
MSTRLAAGVRPGSAEGVRLSPGSTCSTAVASLPGSTPALASSERDGSTWVHAHSRCSVSRSSEPSSSALAVARPSRSRADSVSSRPMGTRWTAGGEAPGVIPKKRFSRSEKGSGPGPPKDPKDDSDMVGPPRRCSGWWLFRRLATFSTRTKGDAMRLLGREDVGAATGPRGRPGHLLHACRDEVDSTASAPPPTAPGAGVAAASRTTARGRSPSPAAAPRPPAPGGREARRARDPVRARRTNRRRRRPWAFPWPRAAMSLSARKPPG